MVSDFGPIVTSEEELSKTFLFTLIVANLSSLSKLSSIKSLLTIANENDDYQRVVLSEYHAAASPVGAFMLRKGKYKYVYFAEGYKPQLFNLEEDQFEENDLALDKNFTNIVDDFYKDLLNICDPEEVNKRAKKEQNERILKHGGIEAIQGRGDFGYSPAPGQKVEFD